MKVLVTGSLGLVGSECVKLFLSRGHEVIGIDNHMRSKFFGEDGDVSANKITHKNYRSYRDDFTIGGAPIISIHKPDIIIHAAAQPSHDWSAKFPMDDFTINALGTIKLLESFRYLCPDGIFIFLSTNKVYGDRPNQGAFIERPTRYERVTQNGLSQGIDESMPIDNCIHSPFGVSKAAADLMVQEYGKYYGLRTGVFRCGCITGKAHAGAELHGFLSYMMKCKKQKRVYTIYGYKGKQVRDNIHAADLAQALFLFSMNPKRGEVYNMGGGRYSNISVLEAIQRIGVEYEYVDQARKGDHMWYISDVMKFQNDYPGWTYTYGIEKILEDLA